MNAALEQIRERLGSSAVLLPIPPNAKGPRLANWQKTTRAAMNDPAYLARFNGGGNIGVLLGEASDGLCTVDLDGQEEAEAFLAINPELRATLQTSRVRGENVWLRIRGEFPAAGKIKDRATRRDLGEWRATGNQTVIHGAAMDASKGETQPTAYRILVDAPPLEIGFHEILWPDGWLLPWKREEDAPERQDAPLAPAGVIVLPSGEVGILGCARTVFPLLAKSRRVFSRAGVPVEVVGSSGGAGGGLALEVVRAAAFRSRLEACGPVMVWRKGRNGRDVLQTATCPEDMARALLESEPARDLLPPISVVTGCPVAVEDADGNVQVLGRGYHSELGGLLVTAGSTPPRVDVAEAVKALSDLLTEFDFQTPSDRSRALAAFISPALSIGGFIRDRVPADVAEADQSQAGKGFRQKMTAALYNESPRVVAQREGVGSLDESFSQALIAGRPFIQLDNLRGAVSSTFLESFFTADTIGARIPHQKEVQVDPRRFFILASSNGVETSRDLANRASFVRIRKREGFQFRTYPEGGLLEHAKARQPYYLGCVFSIIAEWLASSKPRTADTRHDFREWAQTLDWIVQRLFGAAPLLDGHQSAQERVSNPALVFMRALCLAAEQDRRLDESFSASALAELAEAHGIKIPGLREGKEDRGPQQVGVHLGRLFKIAEEIEVDGFRVRRSERLEFRHDGNGSYPAKAYELARI